MTLAKKFTILNEFATIAIGFFPANHETICACIPVVNIPPFTIMDFGEYLDIYDGQFVDNILYPNTILKIRKQDDPIIDFDPNDENQDDVYFTLKYGRINEDIDPLFDRIKSGYTFKTI